MQAHVDRKSKAESAPRVVAYVGFVAYAMVGLAYVLGGLLLVPGLWLVPLWGGWLGGLGIAYRLTRRRSWWVLAAAPVALAVLWLYVEAGWGLWGWIVEDLPPGGR
ncbi:MAG: hypothetical protein ACLFWM_06105 [Actinomycetota bacterium]